jgi:hypothetical protein
MESDGYFIKQWIMCLYRILDMLHDLNTGHAEKILMLVRSNFFLGGQNTSELLKPSQSSHLWLWIVASRLRNL